MNASKENLRLLEEYINIKNTRYNQYNDFICDYKISFEKDGRLNFSVLTEEKNERKKL